ncbi:MAG: DUF1156 domain-containing protein, partial [Verrucomicrobia bacterium]|nr:DUF1156 domain-containing protein [Verrucomicrobiota bacterium]
MTDKPRLIERAFPLKQASLTSVHEKNVRHGHISTLHIWPARRPLAACRAALLATLLPDPGTPEERRKLCERIGGKVVENIERKKMPNGKVVERIKEEVEGGILGWIGTEPKSGGKKKLDEHRDTVAHRERELNWFREEIKKAYGGLPAPRPGLFFVYAIECEDGSHYIGQTDNLQRRWQEHLDGRAADSSKQHKPVKIAHFEELASREEAVKRESDLKTGFGRKWLKDLI